MHFYGGKKSADQGFVESQFAVGHMLHDGRGTEQNFEKAFYYYLLASQKGHADARKNA